MSGHLRQMNCVWMEGGPVETTATPLIFSAIFHWFPSDTAYLIQPHGWGMRHCRGERMDGICIKTHWQQSLYFSDPPPLPTHTHAHPTSHPHMQPFLNHAVVTPWLYPHRHLSSPLSLPSSASSCALSPSLHLFSRGVSEWWSFSGPCERPCGFQRHTSQAEH